MGSVTFFLFCGGVLAILEVLKRGWLMSGKGFFNPMGFLGVEGSAEGSMADLACFEARVLSSVQGLLLDSRFLALLLVVERFTEGSLVDFTGLGMVGGSLPGSRGLRRSAGGVTACLAAKQLASTAPMFCFSGVSSGVQGSTIGVGSLSDSRGLGRSVEGSIACLAALQLCSGVSLPRVRGLMVDLVEGFSASSGLSGVTYWVRWLGVNPMDFLGVEGSAEGSMADSARFMDLVG